MEFWAVCKMVWRGLFLLLVLNPNVSQAEIYNEWNDPDLWYINPHNFTGWAWTINCLDSLLYQYPRRCGLYNEVKKRLTGFFCSGRLEINPIFAPLGLAIGIPGNLLILLVLFKMPLEPRTSYLGIMTAADFLAVLAQCIEDIYVPFKILFINLYAEFAMSVLSVLFSTFSSWVLALLCVERFVSYQWPDRNIYTIPVTIVTSVIFLIISIAPASVTVIFREYPSFLLYWGPITIFQYILCLYIPAFCIILFTSLTIYKIQISRRLRKEAGTKITKMAESAGDATKVTISASFTFLILMLMRGCVISYVIYLRYNPVTPYTYPCPLVMAFVDWLYPYFIDGMYMMNNAVKFYVYLICVPGFRKLFISTVLSLMRHILPKSFTRKDGVKVRKSGFGQGST